MNRANIKILLVDDEPSILTALNFLVQQQGYEVFMAQDGAQALAAMHTHRPHIVVLDVMMPGMDGFEVARQIRLQEAFDNVRIIFLTAKGTQQDRFTGYDSGAELYLVKPFDNDHFINMINELVEWG